MPNVDATPTAETDEKTPRLRLRKIVIERFPNVEPGTVLRFDADRTVLLGKNGSGKTTLLELIVSILSGGFGFFSQEPLMVITSFSCGELSWEMEIENKKSEHEIDFSSRSRTEGSGFEMSRRVLSASYRGSSVPLEVLGLLPPWICDIEQGKRKSSIAFVMVFLHFRTKRHNFFDMNVDQLLSVFEASHWSNVGDVSWVWDGLNSLVTVESGAREVTVGAFVTILGEVWRAFYSARLLWRFDESLGFESEAIDFGIDISVYSKLTGSGHYEATSRTSRNGRVVDLLEECLVDKVFDGGTLQSQEDVSLVENDVLFSSLADIMNVSDIRLKVTLVEKKSQQDQFGDGRVADVFLYKRPQYYFSESSGSVFDLSRASYGQRRIFSFALYLSEYEKFAVVDELVNGLHYEWIEACLDMLGDRQAFLTSQNPVMVDHFEFESEEDVRATFVICENVEKGWRWRNLTEDESRDFFEAYEVGIQHVSEILRAKELW